MNPIWRAYFFLLGFVQPPTKGVFPYISLGSWTRINFTGDASTWPTGLISDGFQKGQRGVQLGHMTSAAHKDREKWEKTLVNVFLGKFENLKVQIKNSLRQSQIIHEYGICTHTFTTRLNQMWVNTPDMDDIGEWTKCQHHLCAGKFYSDSSGCWIFTKSQFANDTYLTHACMVYLPTFSSFVWEM